MFVCPVLDCFGEVSSDTCRSVSLDTSSSVVSEDWENKDERPWRRSALLGKVSALSTPCLPQAFCGASRYEDRLSWCKKNSTVVEPKGSNTTWSSCMEYFSPNMFPVKTAMADGNLVPFLLLMEASSDAPWHICSSSTARAKLLAKASGLKSCNFADHHCLNKAI